MGGWYQARLTLPNRVYVNFVSRTANVMLNPNRSEHVSGARAIRWLDAIAP